MDKEQPHKRTVDFLYPPLQPFDTRMLDVGDGHRIYMEQVGNPTGIPVVVLHGGPGGGCSPAMRRYFNPAKYRVILFDQRGCGRSRPHATVDHNTTWHLVDDIETIRKTLNIREWCVFGGSWGATLALIYAQTHPDRVVHMALRGVFLGTQSELDWFYGGGAGAVWPELWDKFTSLIPMDEQDDMISAYHKRLFCGDPLKELKYARMWASWENALASFANAGVQYESPAEYARAFARLECHYFHNALFLGPGQQILDNTDKLAGIGGVIVQGRYDMICPPKGAHRLAQKWGGATLSIIPNAGHALSEPGISAALIKAMDDFAA